MPNCKICGQTVSAAPVFHPACWEEAAHLMAAKFCAEYCRFPRECKDEDDLADNHCGSCHIVRLLNLGL